MALATMAALGSSIKSWRYQYKAAKTILNDEENDES